MTNQLVNLRCEYFSNPLGLDVTQPRLFWQLETDRQGARQTAYQVRVSSAPDQIDSPDLWDSGRVESDQSTHVAYAGAPLQSRQRAWWQVTVWDETGATVESEVAYWETGLLNAADWSAQWVAAPLHGGKYATTPAPFLRRDFAVEGEITGARLYVTALGIYEVEINGSVVGDGVFTPGWTDYDKRVQYQTYDVTELVQSGENAIGATLGDGWYSGHVAAAGRQNYGLRPQLLAQLEITRADGSRQTITTNGEWKTAFGPIVSNDLIMGEHYDARLEFEGWSRPGFDAAAWHPVEVQAAPNISVDATRGPLVTRTQELVPVNIQKRGRNYVVDFGQNLVGRIRITVQGQEGHSIRFRFGECLQGGPPATEGDVYFDNLRSAEQIDVYTLKGGDAPETWEPRFTFHGFRFVEINGWPGDLEPEAIVAVVLHSDTPATGEFECSDPLINQLQRNIDWGQRGNFLEVPTDCPQRDERLGWTGDAQVFIRTAAFNRDVASFFTKWAQDVTDSQFENGGIPPVVPVAWKTQIGHEGGPAWADATIICPWTIYLCYGDKRILETHYQTFTRFVDFLTATSRDNLRCYEGYEGFHGFGDWLALDGSGKTEGGTSRELLGTAFYAHSVDLLSRIAGVLGKTEDVERYQQLFQKIRASYQARYITAQGLVAGGTQTAYLLSLQFGLMPEELREAASDFLVSDIRSRGWKLSAGFAGGVYINHVLTQTGHLDVAYKLLAQKQWPSWLYAVTQGATTIWERWDGWTHDKGFQNTGMNSFNHYAYGAIGDWLYARVAGLDLDPSQPAYKHTVIHPLPGGHLTSARAKLHTLYGVASSGWTLEDGTLRLEVTVAPNTTATVQVPGTGVSPPDGAEPVVDADNTYHVGAGSYVFTSSLSSN